MDRKIGREGCMLEGSSNLFNDSGGEKKFIKGAVEIIIQ